MKRIVSIVLCFSMTILLLVGCDMLDREMNTFKDQIKGKQYGSAGHIYDTFDAEERTNANKWMKEYVKSLETDYYAGKVDFATANEILGDMMQFTVVFDDAMQAIENISTDNQSSIAFEKAKQYANEEKWEYAYYEIQDIDVSYRYYDEASALRTKCMTNVKTKTLKEIDSFAASGEIEKMLEACDNGLMVLHDDREIILAMQKYLDAYVTKVLNEAKAFADKRQFVQAIEAISSAQNIHDCSQFQEAFEKYQEYIPRNLSECHLIDCSSKNYVRKDDHIDSFGNKYTNAIKFSDAYQDTYAVYKLDGKFLNLKGKLAPGDNHNGAGMVKIYTDNKLVYESKTINRTTEAFNFSIDVTGCKQLRIEVLNDRDYGYWSYIIMDATVS